MIGASVADMSDVPVMPSFAGSRSFAERLAGVNEEIQDSYASLASSAIGARAAIKGAGLMGKARAPQPSGTGLNWGNALETLGKGVAGYLSRSPERSPLEKALPDINRYAKEAGLI